MEEIVWDSSFSVGCDEMDHQHRRIVDVINRLIENPDCAVNSELVSFTLTELTRYASDHFKAEEALLADYDYSKLLEHREEHQQYRRQVVALCQDTIAQSHLVPQALIHFIRDWWVNHILEEDMKYRSLFEQQA
jgi:hemerythrin